MSSFAQLTSRGVLKFMTLCGYDFHHSFGDVSRGIKPHFSIPLHSLQHVSSSLPPLMPLSNRERWRESISSGLDTATEPGAAQPPSASIANSLSADDIYTFGIWSK
jgi:hypothetical protein